MPSSSLLGKVSPLLVLVALLTVTAYLSVYYQPVSTILVEYRLNRVLAVIASGYILGVIGSYLQASLRNPLVDHYILGIGSGSLFAVYLSIMFLGFNVYIVPTAAVIGGFTALFLTISIAEAIGGSDASYVLSGLGVNSLFSGLSILLIYIVSTKHPFAAYMLVGSFTTASPRHQPVLITVSLVVTIAYFILAKPLNTLILGDTYAKQLGYEPRKHRFLAILVSGFSASIIVSMYGLIGFIGLVAPHIARLMLRTIDNRWVSPASGLTASLLLLLTDDFSRLVLSDIVGEIPTGAIVSVFGAPFFLFLVLTRFKGRV